MKAWQFDNLIVLREQNKLVDQWPVSYDLKIFPTNVKIKHFDNFQTVAFGNLERHMRKASHCGSKQQ